MKTIFLFFGSLLFSLFIRAQTIDTAYMECWYKFSYINLPLETMGEDLMVLQIGKNCSKFYSQYTHENDSLLATPEGMKVWRQLFEAGFATGNFPHSRTLSYIHKNYPENQITVADQNNLSHYKFTEDLEKQNWQIQPETKEILGFSCQKADCEFRGRKYEAWFTPEIPIHDGPWKLCGLPGLILKADADNGKYRFEATGIETTNKTFPEKMYGHELSNTVKRKDMLKLQWTFYNNSGAQMNAEFGTSMQEIQLPEGFDLIETDYK